MYGSFRYRLLRGLQLDSKFPETLFRRAWLWALLASGAICTCNAKPYRSNINVQWSNIRFGDGMNYLFFGEAADNYIYDKASSLQLQ